jgi:hypothetical protein|eukprot:COSAG01_NODE_9407_length_2454_cov_2.752866_2_plen_58_part_00
MPFGNYFSEASHIKELVALGVKGYYAEGCPHPGVDMIDLKTYRLRVMMLTFRTLWVD